MPRFIRFIPRKPVALAACFLVVLACGGDAGSGLRTTVVTVAPGDALLVGVGSVVTFEALGTDEAGNAVSSSPVWSSADPRVATIAGNGVATAVSAGTTTVIATIDGVVGEAQLEVYVPDEPPSYEPGTSYFGRASYVEYIPGRLPVVLSAPHGGTLEPREIPDRTYGVTVSDRRTLELTLAVREALLALTGYAPHVVLSHLRRTKLDPNREIVEAAQESPYAEQAWKEFQGWIGTARTTVEQDFERGLYFDMHGHGHELDRLELGYLLSADELNQSDASLDALAVVASSSIRDLGRESPLRFSQLLRGPTSLGGYLGAEGVRSVPSPADPSPGASAYFSGGYNTRQHGSSMDGETVSGIQIEHHFPGIRDTEENRRAYAARLARVIRDYMLEHYGFFAPGE